jgi:hypothetical protein
MKKMLFLLAFSLTVTAPAMAEHIYESYDGATTPVGASSNSSDTNTVDLSSTSDTTVYSPSLGNSTPAGQAPGQPINND